MNRPQTFTGRHRARGSRSWAKVADAIARCLITTGGLGTILAVLLVCVFLLAVVLPLFRSASGRLLHSGRLFSPAGHAAEESGATDQSAVDAGERQPKASESAVRGEATRVFDLDGPVRRLEVDESGRVALAVMASGDVVVYEVTTGRVLQHRSAEAAGLQGISAIALTASGSGVAGFLDGSVARMSLSLRSTYLSQADLPAPLAGLKPGETSAWEDSVVICMRTDQFARLDPVVELAERVQVSEAAESESTGPVSVEALDCVALAEGPLMAALASDGSVMIETVSQKRNLMTDELVSRSRRVRIEPAVAAGDGNVPRHVLVNDLGDQMLLVGDDGRATRWSIRVIESPKLLESVVLVRNGRRVEAIARLFGGMAFAVGDDSGTVDVWYPIRPPEDEESGRQRADLPEDGLTLVRAKSIDPDGEWGGVDSLTPSTRSRLFAVVHDSGRIRLLHSTSAREVLAFRIPGSDRATQATAALAPRDDLLLTLADGVASAWVIDPGYPEVSAASLFGEVWYEGYPQDLHAWETTGHEAFESKFGLVPLVFGTLKATLYSMQFAAPIAVLDAISSSHFMHPSWRSRIKPIIESMASLPSVVLGFVAGLVFAPAIEGRVMVFLSSLVTVPVALVTLAHLWQMLPGDLRARGGRLRFPLVAFVAIPCGLAAAAIVSPAMEVRLFGGDFVAWLDGRGDSGIGGWIITLMPLAGLVVAFGIGRFLSPFLRQAGADWSVPRAALTSLVTFLTAVVLAVVLAAAGGILFDALRFDARGGVFGTYVQRNALVVAVGMGFAIIPLIFTIADDALSSVPEHLRSASLGAGATPWQTAVRVIVPAATSGIFSAIMIGLGRAVGETMIVLMAAGNTPILDWNLFNGFQTLSAAIASELPEAARGSAHSRVLFLAALTLFVITFVVNTAAELVRQRVRRRSYEL
ncbi:MAG: ABC transporter permease subunit [Planctomycetaceae bacterium]